MLPDQRQSVIDSLKLERLSVLELVDSTSEYLIATGHDFDIFAKVNFKKNAAGRI